MTGVAKQVRAGEDRRTAFVHAIDDIDSIGRSVCALLNTEGGVVLCGVGAGDEADVNNTDEARARLEIGLKKEISPTALFTVGVDDYAGRPILVVEVPEGKDRPYVFKGGVYVRRGSKTQAVDASTLRMMVQGQVVAAERWERRPSPTLDDDDLDIHQILATAVEAEEAGRLKFRDPRDPTAVLRELAMLTPRGYTQAADVVFSKDPSRRHPQCRARLVRYASDKTDGTYEDDRTFVGPLVVVLKDVLEATRSHARVQSVFTDEARRKDRPEYVAAALREGLVNAFAHRDYSSFSGGITVSIFPDRIQIWNSGRLPAELKPGHLRGDHPSIPTNPDMAQVLYLRGYMERIGRGTQKIIAASRDIGAPAPKWEDRPSGVTLTIFSANIEPALNERQTSLLAELAQDDELRLSEYIERFARELTPRQAQRDLAILVEAHLLTMEGRGRATTYRRTARKT